MDLFLTPVKKIIHKLGIDDSIFWSTINKGFGIIRAPLTIYFLVKYLSPDEQGLWYTFTSLAALSMLADLGFTSIITQFISHEYARLELKDGRINGPGEKIDRFMALIKFSLSFYLKIIILAILILLTVGFFYFNVSHIQLLAAWAAFSIGGGLSLLVSLFQAIFQGLDKMKLIQINILLNSFVVTFFTCLTLFLQFKIWALVVGSLIGTFLTAWGLYVIGKPLWKQVYRYNIRFEYNFFKETLPLQVRYAVSFICSYLISYLYVPAVYKFIGAMEAGQLGLSISIVTVISSIANSWLFTKVPKFNILVSNREFKALDILVKKSMLQGLFIQTISSVIFVLCIIVVNRYFNDLSWRFLGLWDTVLFLLPQLAIFIITGLTLYLRAFKKEPLMWLQIFNAGLLVLAIGLILSAGFGLENFFYAVNIIYWIVILPAGWILFKRKRKDLIAQQMI
jgi:O-antigen/teichoic acid export membrane protein